MSDRHLWEYDHPYYCGEATWHRNVDGSLNHYRWGSWSEFRDDTIFVTGDRDLNLLVRWDWVSYHRHPDPEMRTEDGPDQLMLAFVMQRKGYLATHEIEVTDEDEAAIRAWLVQCAETTRQLWDPLLALPAGAS